MESGVTFSILQKVVCVLYTVQTEEFRYCIFNLAPDFMITFSLQCTCRKFRASQLNKLNLVVSALNS